MIKVKFELKNGVIKEVDVDFFSTDYIFSNHLKRCVNNQVLGSIQKNFILNLVNKGVFTVTENNVEIYQKKMESDSTYNSNTGITYINTSNEVTNIDQLDMEGVCAEFDLIEQKMIELHLRLQTLLNQEENNLLSKMSV
jgi:hypothetical protein